ncbi:MAG TPA: uracil-DNA glycosylase [Myxococcales bacterium]|jgi:DNA polymerase
MAEPGPASDREELASIALDLCGHLEWLRENGVREVPAVPKPVAAPAAGPAKAEAATPEAGTAPVSGLRAAVRAAAGVPDKRPAAPPPSAAPSPLPAKAPPAASGASSRTAPEPAKAPAAVAPATAPAPAAEKPAHTSLEQIRAELGDCKRCKLHQKRKNIVFGVGSSAAQLVFVGEGPGADEDTQGIPFVGAAGQLLTKMIEAMGFTRDEVYICNVVKCRPPGNRDPEPEEISACEVFLKAQLALLKPKAIVTLGKFATMTLLREPGGSITRMRGQWRRYQGIPLMPTFHPSYLLRQKTQEEIYSEKKKVWDDLQQVMKVLGREPPAKK